MRTARGVHTNSLTVQSGRLHFGFVTQVSIFVEEKDDPVESKYRKYSDDMNSGYIKSVCVHRRLLTLCNMGGKSMFCVQCTEGTVD